MPKLQYLTKLFIYSYSIYILKMRRKIFFAFFCIVSTTLLAQRGRDLSPVISTTVEVNEYTPLTADAPAGSAYISVASSSLNAHGRFSAALSKGDLIMIIQMQGATLNGHIHPVFHNVGLPDDSSWGSILNYNNCGNYEFAEVDSVPISGVSIKLDCPLKYSYTDTGIVQIVRVPRYNSLTINNGGKITCDPWDSAKGGIIAIEVENNTVINAGGSINADSAGFRGGRYNGQDSIGWGVTWYSSTFQSLGKEKGEGVGGFEWRYTQYGGKEGMGAPGNGGGGGNCQNGGGGGGANGGVVANYINGFGNPDISTPNNITAWNLEYSWMSAFTSSGGGRGGYSYGSNQVNPLTDGPGNINPAWATAWAGDQRRSVGGRGGRPLDYSTGKIFMGGGGGAGDQNDNYGGIGGAGGGLIYLMSYGTISGSGQIVSNGENGYNTHGVASFGHAAGMDGAGGAGAGGTIIVNSVGNISGITLNANGGTGGKQVMTWNFSTDKESEGPGGGGGGGYIATSNGGLTETVTGGANGTTNSMSMPNFPPNGATIGGAGTSNAIITNFYLAPMITDTICSGNTATLNETILGNPPGGTSVEWYTVDSGGSAIATGPSFTTPVLVTTTTYYVGTCPGTYRIPVKVVVKDAGAVTISPNNSICKGASDTLKATGGSAYAWLPVSGLSNPAIANPVATPTATTTYTVSITTTCGVVKDSVKVTVIPLPNITIGASSNPICAGQSATITASGGGTYLWSNASSSTTSSISVTPLSNTTYSVMVTNAGCSKDTSILITVTPLPTVTLSATKDTVCAGSPTTISATGGGTYQWSDASSSTTSSISVTPLSSTTYTVTVTKNGCQKDTTYTIAVTPLPVVTISQDTSICTGGTATIIATGGGTYSWAPIASTSSSISVSPGSMTVYTVTVTKNGCSNVAHDTVNVSSTLVVNITLPQQICAGETVTLKATGGGTYHWSTGATTDSITVKPNTNTTYSVTVTNGCVGTATTSVSVVNTSIAACCDTVIQSGNSTHLSANGAGITHYTWAPATGLVCDTCANITVSPTITTSYTVTGTNAQGCPVQTIIIVTVEQPCFTDTIPNVFTPTVPGPKNENNIFRINTANLNSWSVFIYDRWGKEVFKTTDLNQYWDGRTEGGSQAPAGIYYYLINTTCNGNTTKRQGFVQLIR